MTEISTNHNNEQATRQPPMITVWSWASVQSYISEHLDRPLDEAEVACIQRLSPQGIAKVNHDIMRGVSAAETLADLRAVYDRTCLRKQQIQASLKVEAKRMLAQLSRAPTTDELALFASVPITELKTNLRRRVQRGETFEMAIEDMAQHYKYRQLSVDAAAFAKAENLPTKLNYLAATVRPSTPEALAPTMALVEEDRGIALIGLSPILSWFVDTPEEIVTALPIQEDQSLRTKTSSFRRRYSGTLEPVAKSVAFGEPLIATREGLGGQLVPLVADLTSVAVQAICAACVGCLGTALLTSAAPPTSTGESSPNRRMGLVQKLPRRPIASSGGPLSSSARPGLTGGNYSPQNLGKSTVPSPPRRRRASLTTTTTTTAATSTSSPSSSTGTEGGTVALVPPRRASLTTSVFGLPLPGNSNTANLPRLLNMDPSTLPNPIASSTTAATPSPKLQFSPRPPPAPPASHSFQSSLLTPATATTSTTSSLRRQSFPNLSKGLLMFSPPLASVAPPPQPSTSTTTPRRRFSFTSSRSNF